MTAVEGGPAVTPAGRVRQQVAQGVALSGPFYRDVHIHTEVWHRYAIPSPCPHVDRELSRALHASHVSLRMSLVRFGRAARHLATVLHHS